jgi:hypothetical protein
MASKGQCIYCAQEIRGVRKGEHVVPDALGANVTIRRVCALCNNELSQLDKELVTASPLHIAASKHPETNGEDFWDYNPQLDLAIEGRLVDGRHAVAQWPQLVLDGSGLIFCYDVKEIEKVGLQKCQETFRLRLLEAVQTVRRGDRRPKLRWCSLPNPPRRGRFPPRVFTRHTCDDLPEGISFECRWHGKIDKNSIMQAIEHWKIDNADTQESRMEGVADPEGATSYRPRWVLRALVKIGLNLLAYLMEDEFPRDGFDEAIRFVRYDHGSGPSTNTYGFLDHNVTTQLECPANAHKFTLQHASLWTLDCSFFGGAIGATVAFPGPKWRKARRIEITAPIHGNEWQVQRSQILIPRRRRVTDRIDAMMPWAGFAKVRTRTRIVRREAQPRVSDVS